MVHFYHISAISCLSDSISPQLALLIIQSPSRVLHGGSHAGSFCKLSESQYQRPWMYHSRTLRDESRPFLDHPTYQSSFRSLAWCLEAAQSRQPKSHVTMKRNDSMLISARGFEECFNCQVVSTEDVSIDGISTVLFVALPHQYWCSVSKRLRFPRLLSCRLYK